MSISCRQHQDEVGMGDATTTHEVCCVQGNFVIEFIYI